MSKDLYETAVCDKCSQPVGTLIKNKKTGKLVCIRCNKEINNGK